jgi:hypothetical protein
MIKMVIEDLFSLLLEDNYYYSSGCLATERVGVRRVWDGGD